MRPDIWEIIDYAFEVGLHPVIGTNGTLITDDGSMTVVIDDGSINMPNNLPYAYALDTWNKTISFDFQGLRVVQTRVAQGLVAACQRCLVNGVGATSR